VQTLMLVAAADDTGRLGTVRRAAAALGVEASAWEEAERSGLLTTPDHRVQVRHPLVRSAVYQAAGGPERRRVHRALADALGDVDPDRQAWHQAAAAEGPDEEVVTALERVAFRAERGGGYVTAATAYERASELSATQQDRVARQYAAARNAWASGQATRASALLAAAREHVDDPLLGADIDRLRGRIEVNVGSATSAHRTFVDAARTVADADPARALEMAVAAAVMRNYGADSGASIDTAGIRDDARLDDTPRTRCLVQLLMAMTAADEGDWDGALESLRHALVAGRDVSDVDLLGNLGNAALNLGDDQASSRFYTRMLSSARAAGAGMSVVYALQRLAFPQFLAGRWAELRASAEEALSLSRSVGQPRMTAAPLAWLTLLAALEGRAEYDALLAELAEVAQRPLGILTDPVHDLTRWAMGTRASPNGENSAGLHHLSRMRLPTLTRMAALDRIEAAVRAGDPDRAKAWIRELERFASTTRWAWALAGTDFGRAMLAAPADAPALFENALAHQGRAARPYDAARTHLAYGELLRRSQRRVDARPHLRAGVETFADLQAEPLLARATSELRASGETARRRDPSTVLTLTPMELKVAQLVSRGLSNKDVAAQCWVSPRTVAFHLRNVFAKTAVTSRAELAHLRLE
jgi:DNA-binding CsgD family transcriptional regulator